MRKTESGLQLYLENCKNIIDSTLQQLQRTEWMSE